MAPGLPRIVSVNGESNEVAKPNIKARVCLVSFIDSIEFELILLALQQQSRGFQVLRNREEVVGTAAVI